MSDYATNLSRLRAIVRAQVPLPEDVGAWAIALAESAAPAAVLRRRRDELLRRAAAMIPGPPEHKAAALLRELERIARHPPRETSDPLRRTLVEVRQLGRPLGHRQTLRVLARER